ncbi:hypothetical protein BCR34DRAFT_594975 [Clohesyomyces aquaticus]|uniref:Uncharacterized protein n=1 Tax=Clohesyomyces aquaticus TaxID=1231657 RepID=A0A1Y1Y1C2_9PLEO|nr:hypothetical protein BCR34DRAFT_594975 [Clohesyomyces aquaticus]
MLLDFGPTLFASIFSGYIDDIDDNPSSQRAVPWRAPTWSCASVVGGTLTFDLMSVTNDKIFFDIKSWEYIPINGANETRELESAVLHLSGYLWQTELEHIKTTNGKTVFHIHGIGRSNGHDFICLDFELRSVVFPIGSTKTIWIMRGYEHGWEEYVSCSAEALLIVQGRDAGTFERIGLWHYEPKSSVFWGENVGAKRSTLVPLRSTWLIYAP